MTRLVLLITLLLLTSCVRVLPDVATPGHRTLSLAQSPAQLYNRSLHTLTALGILPTFSEAQSQTILAIFPGETQPLRLVAQRSVIGHTLTLDGPESSIITFMTAFETQR